MVVASIEFLHINPKKGSTYWIKNPQKDLNADSTGDMNNLLFPLITGRARGNRTFEPILTVSCPGLKRRV